MEHLTFRMYNKATRTWLCGYEQLGGFYILGETVLMGGFDFSLSHLNDIDVMQFTGMYDKHNNKIYDKDVLLIEGICYFVKFFEGGFTLFTDTDEMAWKYTDWEDLRSYAWNSEVIGNLYDGEEYLYG